MIPTTTICTRTWRAIRVYEIVVPTNSIEYGSCAITDSELKCNGKSGDGARGSAEKNMQRYASRVLTTLHYSQARDPGHGDAEVMELQPAPLLA